MTALHVPYIPRLEEMTPQEINDILETRGARTAIDNANWPQRFPYKPIANATLAASDTHLIVGYFVRGLGLLAQHQDLNSAVCSDSCVEIFIERPDGGYCNFEMNCIGALNASSRKSRREDVSRITPGDALRVIRHTSVAPHTFAELDGLHEWTAILGIPFAMLGHARRPERLRANLYKCADASRWPHYLSWAPIPTERPDFHRPDHFGTLILHPAR